MAVPFLNADFIANFGIVADVVAPAGLPAFTPKTSYTDTPKFRDYAGIAATSASLATSPLFYDLVDVTNGKEVLGVHASRLRDLVGIKTYVAGAGFAGGAINTEWTEPADGTQYVYVIDDYTDSTLKLIRYRITAIRLIMVDLP